MTQLLQLMLLQELLLLSLLQAVVVVVVLFFFTAGALFTFSVEKNKHANERLTLFSP